MNRWLVHTMSTNVQGESPDVGTHAEVANKGINEALCRHRIVDTGPRHRHTTRPGTGSRLSRT